jgi:hypothetical protein
MKLIHGRGFKIDEKRRLVPFIYRQVLSVVRCICRAMRILRIKFQEDQNEVSYQCSSGKTKIDHFLYIGICSYIKFTK